MNTQLKITPNRRLARFLYQQTGSHYHSWNDWLLEVWQTAYETIVGSHPLQCLSDWQSILLWQSVISDLHGDLLLNQAQAVQHARQAWALGIQWQSDPANWQGEKPETDSFLTWLSAYQERCAKNSWIDRALLPARLFEYWQGHPTEIPAQVEFYGFDEFTPLQTSILDFWKSQGSTVIIEPASTQVQPYTYLAFQDRESQLTQAALFAKAALQTENDLPIGIVIPAIQDNWANIYDIFTAVLGPEQPFNISAGQPLAQCPVIHAALQCLSAIDYSYLLRTPYISGGLSEQSARALCDLTLSRLQQEQLPIHFVRTHLALPEQFRSLFNTVLDKLADFHQVQYLPSVWIEKIFELLTLWGWPGDRTLSSEAYQAVSHFYALITELSSLDQIVDKCSYQKIVHLLTQRLHQTMFQAESQDKPIQVLGFLEAAGMSFSHLWVMDMGSDTWPEKPTPNPFIPMKIQIELGIPHASFSRELRFAQTMTQRLLTSSQHIIMSYAQHGEGEGMVLPTPLLQNEPVNVNEREKFYSLAEQLFQASDLEPMPDLIGLPFTCTQLKGGASMFKDQAACPFRAYAKHRLNAIKPEPARMGLSEKTKGTLVHDILEKAWANIKTREALLNLGKNNLSELLMQLITRAVNQLTPPISSVEQQLEVQRLHPIFMRWFDLELERGPFEIIALEKTQTVTWEGLTMHLRVDRIDKVDNQLQIIDYKTGEVKIKSWEDERMDEPQLPLYACVNQPEPQAIYFAQIRKDDMGFKGVETSDKLAEWKHAFTVLANEFKQGYAAVLPKRGSATCNHCDFHSICRINHAD